MTAWKNRPIIRTDNFLHNQRGITGLETAIVLKDHAVEAQTEFAGLLGTCATATTPVPQVGRVQLSEHQVHEAIELGARFRTGDARRAMYVTLGSGLAAAVLDPLFIFGLDLGLDGAAISTVLSRMIMVAIGLHGVLRVHRLLAMPRQS